jgi:hypothetical protein
MATKASLYSLPNELLTQIAECLSDTPQHLQKSDLIKLARTSQKLRPIAEAIIYRSASLTGGVSPQGPHQSHNHPPEGVNDLLQLLRTLLKRPELATKFKSVYLRTIRRNRIKLYEKAGPGIVDLKDLQEKSLAKLNELGYENGNPWCNMIESFIESAFAGLLFALVPSVEDIKIAILDHARGDPCPDPILAMFGSYSLPEIGLLTVQNIKRLSIIAEHFQILSLDFANLVTLDLEHTSTRDMLRLNGPTSLRGASKVKKLSMKLVIQLAETFVVKHLGAKFEDLLAAMGFPALTHLDIEFLNEGCRCPEGHAIEMKTFIPELKSLYPTLVELNLGFDDDDETTDQEWILANAEPVETLKKFTALQRLSIPQRFLYDPKCVWELVDVLPSTLQELEIIAPRYDITSALLPIAKDPKRLPNLKSIVLLCRTYNTPAHEFWNEDDVIWELLSERSITAVVTSLDTGSSNVMPVEWSDNESDEEDDDISEGGGANGEGNRDNDSDDRSMPDLELSSDDDDDDMPALESPSGDEDAWESAGDVDIDGDLD